MSSKLVLSVDEGKIMLQDFAAFVKRCTEMKFGPRMEITVENGADEKFLFSVLLPENSSLAKRVVRKTKVQKAVATQIEEYKKAVENGETVPGHVPALVKTPVVKRKCICGVMKPVTRAGNFRTHQSKGIKCHGSGTRPLTPAKKAAAKKAVVKRAMESLDTKKSPVKKEDGSGFGSARAKLVPIDNEQFAVVRAKRAARRAK